jgi:hypothetical protein
VIRFARYDQDGRILGIGVVPNEMFAIQQQPNIVAEWPATDSTHYVFDGELLDREPLGASWDKTEITANGIDEATLSGLPDPCTVRIDGEPHVIVGGQLELSATNPGSYLVQINEVAYLSEQWEITAV